MKPEQCSVNSLRYLLLPSPPTPNGRLHLGHIGGPYLRMDMLKRGVEMFGHRADIVLTLDDYESFVMLSAKNLGWSAVHVIKHFAELIDKDLKSMKIDATIIDPMDAEYDQIYRRFSNDSVGQLVSSGHTETHLQGYYYAQQSGKCVSGTWLLGTCPSCGMTVSGDCCDGCSAIITPQDLIEAHPRFDEGPLQQKKKPVLYYVIEDVEQALDDIKIADEHRETIAKQWLRSDNRIRLSVPALEWGLPLTSVEQLPHSHVFSYASLGLYLTSGEYVAHNSVEGTNPFDDPTARVIMGFGIDNLIHMTYINTLMIATGRRGFDWTLPNYFMQLQGTKFSTSSGHAIWAAEFVDNSGVNVDSLRYHLATISPELAEGNFSLSQFVQQSQAFEQKLKKALDSAFALIDENVYVCEYVNEPKLAQLNQKMRTLYHEHNFSLLCLTAEVEQMLKQPLQSTRQSVEWLLSFTLLIYPLMPDLGQSLWQSLGFGDGKPAFADITPNAGKVHPCEVPQSSPLKLDQYLEYLS